MHVKTWLITGCSSGIGKGIATAVLEKGDQAIITARDTTKLNDFIEKYKDQVLALSLEMSDIHSIKEVIKKSYEHFGQIDVLVNNAGQGMRGAIEEVEDEMILNLFQTNVFGPVQLIKEVLPMMRKQKSGAIINISSTGAVSVNPGSGYYSASKAALENISRALYKEVSSLGIKVMIVEPGPFRTNFRVASWHGNDIHDYDVSSGMIAKNYSENPFNQKGDPMKAGKHIVEAIEREDFPKLLLLGNGMIDLAKQTYHDRISEMERWREYTDSSNFEK